MIWISAAKESNFSASVQWAVFVKVEGNEQTLDLNSHVQHFQAHYLIVTPQGK
jgi:hypothetical protein